MCGRLCEHAATYSGVFHYLEAVADIGVVRAKAYGLAVIEATMRIPRTTTPWARARCVQTGAS